MPRAKQRKKKKQPDAPRIVVYPDLVTLVTKVSESRDACGCPGLIPGLDSSICTTCGVSWKHIKVDRSGTQAEPAPKLEIAHPAPSPQPKKATPAKEPQPVAAAVEVLPPAPAEPVSLYDLF